MDDLASGLREAGITEFGFAMTEPFAGRFSLAGFRKPDDPADQRRDINFMSVSPDYFRTLRVPMVAGRGFDATDAGQGVAIVNEAAAHRHWPGQDVVGQTWLVGRDATTPSAGATVAAIVARLDRRARVEIRLLQDRLDEVLAGLALAPLVVLVLGFFGLVLATVGMFGVFGFVVRQRTREIGIRIALGARAAEIIRLVIAGSSRPVVAGLVVGLLGALGASQVLRSKLYGVSPLDPLTYAGVALLLSVAAMAASYVPARRAVRLNPTQALRE